MKMFTAKERKNLENVLSRAAEEGVAMYLEELHGFLFGLAIAPVEIAPDRWLPLVFDEQRPQFKDQADEAACHRYLTDAYDRIVSDRKAGKLVFPFKIASADLSDVQNWVCGLFLAISLKPDAWKIPAEYSDEEFLKLPQNVQQLMDAFSAITAVAMPDVMQDALAEIMQEEGLSEEEVYALFYEMLPENVAILQDSAEKIRNENKSIYNLPGRVLRVKKAKAPSGDLCACGSGRKYNQCCKAN